MSNIKRAIILSAGVGKRLQPVTLTTPKPLVKVNGVRIIDTIINAIRKNGIEEIYIVVGYLKEAFYEYQEENTGINIIENRDYLATNNISSLYVSREHLSDCVIIEADLIIKNAEIFTPQFERSSYCAIKKDNVEEWKLAVEAGIVQKCEVRGTGEGWQLIGISFWNETDGKRLRELLEKEYTGGNQKIFWDEIALFVHPQEFKLGIRPIEADSIMEIDSYDELIQIDRSYENV